MAFKSYSSRQFWYANTAEVDLAIQKRTVRTKSGKTPLQYFDGATMMSYQVPSRMIETVFCRREPAPFGCNDEEFHLDPKNQNVPTSSFEVKMSEQGKHAGRGVFTKVDIAAESYIAAESFSQSLRFYPSTYKLIAGLEEESDGLEALEYYMHGYGFTSRRFGESEVFVDSSIITFVNHGCNGTYNVGVKTDYNEFSSNLDAPTDDLDGRSHTGTSVFNPVVDRHLFFGGDESLRDIKAGEEILDNYLVRS